MKYYFVINPAAGKGKHTADLDANIRAACEEKGLTYEIYHTTRVGDATEFIKGVCADERNLPARFYACGGDGTLGEAVNGIVGISGASVGVIPVGTGNDFVRNFSFSANFFDISSQLDGAEVKIDLLKCNDFYAINMINIGFDCEVVKKKEKLQKDSIIPSKLAYIAGIVYTLVKKPGVEAEISCDGGERRKNKYLLTTFANGAFCGGGFNSNPYAKLTDGAIDSLFVKNISRMKFIKLVGSYKKGTHIVPKNSEILSAQKFEKVVLRFNEKQSASIDGELFDFKELCIECVKDAVSFIIPAGVLLAEKAEAKETLTVK